MDATRKLARRAGWLYLLQCLPAPFAYIRVPNALLVPDDAVATADRVRASEGLLRAGVAAELFSATLLIYGIVVTQILWGIWLIPLGILVMRSQFIPRWLAYPLFAAAAGYVFNSVGTLFLPSIRGISSYGQILGVGELPILVWLLVWGARPLRAGTA